MISGVLDVMQDLARADMTIFCVTHEMAFAKAVADRVILKAEGEIVEDGTPDQLCNAPRQTDFFTAPPGSSNRVSGALGICRNGNAPHLGRTIAPAPKQPEKN